MKRSIGLLAIVFAFISPAHGGFTQRELASVALEPASDARIPDNLMFEDATGRTIGFFDALAGRPALIIPVDFTCKTLCGPGLTLASTALAGTGLKPGEDFRLVVVGFDPHDSVAGARAFVASRIAEPAVAAATVILQGGAESIRTFTSAIGYRTIYDAQTDQFAHPAGALVMTADGRVSRVLSTVALAAGDLRLALVEAGEGRIGSFRDRLTLLCSQFDPVQGAYTSLIERILQIATGLAVVLLAGALWLYRRYEPQGTA